MACQKWAVVGEGWRVLSTWYRMHHLSTGYQLRVNTNRVQVCDGRAHDGDENETYWGVRNNDNLNQPIQRHHPLKPVA